MTQLCECGCGQPAPLAKCNDAHNGKVKGQPIRFVKGHSGGRDFQPGNNRGLRHGFARVGKEAPAYWAYLAAKRRCTNPNDQAYSNYGGRGIKFLFASLEEFISDIGPRPSPQHSIDRTNNNGHYEPGNVRWATRGQQERNKRSRMTPGKAQEKENINE